MAIPNNLLGHKLAFSLDDIDEVTPSGARLMRESSNLLAEADEMKWRIGHRLDFLAYYRNQSERKSGSKEDATEET